MTGGPVALITGAGSGIGAATAHRLHRRGVRLVLVDRDAGVVRGLAQRLGAVPVVGDVAHPVVHEQAVQAATDTYGRLDLLHANAGRMTDDAFTPVDLASLELDAYRATVAVNTDAVVFGVRAALSELRGNRREGRRSAIVVTASLAGLTPFPPDPIYTLTKHAVVGLVRALADPLAAQAVDISAVCPGFVDTPLIAEARDQFVAADFPLITAEEVADAVELAWLAAEPGALWALQPGRKPIAYRPAGVPGPRTGRSTVPPLPDPAAAAANTRESR